MQEFLTALGLVLVIEGGVYALFPRTMKRAMQIVQMQPAEQLRLLGFGAATAGIGIIWAIDHFLT